jgi:hypothetical protein
MFQGEMMQAAADYCAFFKQTGAANIHPEIHR